MDFMTLFDSIKIKGCLTNMNKMTMKGKDKRDKIYLRVNLRGLILKRFLALKEYYGVENDTELVRILISQEYQRIFGS